MGEVIYFSFEVAEADIASWESVFAVLDTGHRGPKLQKALSVFGNDAVDKLVQITNENGPDCFVFEGWSREGNGVTFELDLPLELVDDFTELFQVCPVKNLSVGVHC